MGAEMRHLPKPPLAATGSPDGVRSCALHGRSCSVVIALLVIEIAIDFVTAFYISCEGLDLLIASKLALWT